MILWWLIVITWVTWDTVMKRKIQEENYLCLTRCNFKRTSEDINSRIKTCITGVLATAVASTHPSHVNNGCLTKRIKRVQRCCCGRQHYERLIHSPSTMSVASINYWMRIGTYRLSSPWISMWFLERTTGRTPLTNFRKWPPYLGRNVQTGII